MTLPRSVFLFLLFSTSFAAAQARSAAVAGSDYALAEMRVSKLQVVGSERKYDDIVAAIGFRPGDRVTSASMKAASDRLGASGIFTQVQYQFSGSPSAVDVVFRVADNPQLVPVYFENLVWLSPAELNTELRRRLPLFDGRVPLVGDFSDRVSEALQAVLAERGVQAQVVAEPQGPLNQLPTAYSYSAKNVSVRIAKLEFAGVQQIDADLLRKAAEPLLKERFSQTFVRGFASRTLLPIYRSRGFLEARFAEPESVLSDASATSPAVDLLLRVEEGRQYRMGTITWVGNNFFASADLTKLIPLAPGEVVDHSKLMLGLAKARALLSTRGLMAATLDPAPTFTQDGVVDYTINVYEGAVYTMGLLEIRGLESARITRLANAFQIKPGMVYDGTYANAFFSGPAASKILPENTLWRFETREVINDETRFVDLTVEFRPHE